MRVAYVQLGGGETSLEAQVDLQIARHATLRP
jgi:hypothetical protein